MTSRARWWHPARAASFIDGVRIIVAFKVEGLGGKRSRATNTVNVGHGKAGRGREGEVQAGGRRPEVSASERLNEGASEQTGRQEVHTTHEWLGCRIQGLRYATCAVVGVGACSRPAAAFSRRPLLPFSPLTRRPAAARSLPYVYTSIRSRLPSRPSSPPNRATGAAATHYPSDSVSGTTPPACWAGGELAGRTTIISRGAPGLATSSRGLYSVTSTRARATTRRSPRYTHAYTHVCERKHTHIYIYIYIYIYIIAWE